MSLVPLPPLPAEAGTDDPRLRRVAAKLRELFRALDLDLADPHLVGTEWRVARAYRQIFAGLYARGEPALRTFPNAEKYSGAVSITDIPFYSVCAHHLLPFFGSAHVAYVPRDRIVGLSKLARVVEFYARRPQVQERMTEQIAQLLEERLRPAGLMIVVQARHLCMEMRGVSKNGLLTTTSAARGSFEDEARRREFLALCTRATPEPAPARSTRRTGRDRGVAIPAHGKISTRAKR